MKIKICGITHPADARYAAELGADYIGIILAKGFKRTVSTSEAKHIAATAKASHAIPVAVFVHEPVDEIIRICEETRIHVVELFGDVAREALPQLMNRYEIIFLTKGTTELPKLSGDSSYLLCEHPDPSLGLPFDGSNTRWMLAGGLNPSNVASLIERFQPDCVTVSSGVEQVGSTRKDPELVKAFIHAANCSKEMAVAQEKEDL